jgi:molybdopterin converting factor subunit 1
MTVRVLFFSVLRNEVGQSVETVTLDGPATGEDVLDLLAQKHPSVEQHRGSLRLAVNESYVPTDVALSDGDELALITPVSGG